VSEHADEARGLIEKFLYPNPLLELGVALRPLATAMIDISDGLHADLVHLLNASKRGAKLKIGALRLPFVTDRWFDVARAIEVALCGGEDYELLFTVAPDNAERVRATAEKQGCQLAQLGVVTASGSAQWWLDDELYIVPDSGYRHFVD
jgi:thiamine-monophosphate kinase